MKYKLKFYQNPNRCYLLKNEDIPYRVSKFPAGEIFLKLEPKEDQRIDSNAEVEIVINPISSDDVMKIFLANDALQRLGFKQIDLYMPYVPYGRQDRVMTYGEPLSLKVFANLVNNCNFRKITICDPHSSVTNALFNNLGVKDISNWLTLQIAKIKDDNPNASIGLISPDAGAVKRTIMASELSGVPVSSIATKERQSNGDIKINLNFNGVAPNVAIISDDICDGGKTFIELAKVLKEEHGVQKVYLIVTHGIFSKGLSVFDGLLDGVTAYNEWPNNN